MKDFRGTYARKKTPLQAELDGVDATVEEMEAEERRRQRIETYWRARGVELHCSIIEATNASAGDGVPVYAIRSNLIMRVPT